MKIEFRWYHKISEEYNRAPTPYSVYNMPVLQWRQVVTEPPIGVAGAEPYDYAEDWKTIPHVYEGENENR